jgi:hypothetical protein
VTTLSEVQQTLELSTYRPYAVVHLVMATDGTERPLSDEIIGHLLQLEPSAALGLIHVAALVLELYNNWTRTRHLVLQVIRQATAPLEFSSFVFFARACVLHDYTAAVADLLVEGGLAEQWAPEFLPPRSRELGNQRGHRRHRCHE